MRRRRENRAKADRLGEQSADQRAEGEAEIIDAVKAAQDAAALIRRARSMPATSRAITQILSPMPIKNTGTRINANQGVNAGEERRGKRSAVRRSARRAFPSDRAPCR